MAYGTPPAPIASSRAAADTTPGRIYFSTPSAQVRNPVGDLVLPPPHLCSHYTTWGKFIQRRRKSYRAAEKISRAEAGGPKNQKRNLSVPKTVAK